MMVNITPNNAKAINEIYVHCYSNFQQQFSFPLEIGLSRSTAFEIALRLRLCH